jgi:hypothetical protein
MRLPARCLRLSSTKRSPTSTSSSTCAKLQNLHACRASPMQHECPCGPQHEQLSPCWKYPTHPQHPGHEWQQHDTSSDHSAQSVRCRTHTHTARIDLSTQAGVVQRPLQQPAARAPAVELGRPEGGAVHQPGQQQLRRPPATILVSGRWHDRPANAVRILRACCP